MLRFVTRTFSMTTTLRRSTRLLSTTTVEIAATAGAESSKPLSTNFRATQRRAKRPRTAPDNDKLPSEEETTLKSTKKRVTAANLTDQTRELEEFDNETKKPKRAKKDAKPIDYSLSDFPQRPESSWKIGPHVSAAGGVENAILNAASIGATAFALFLKSQRKWDSPPLSETSVEAFKARLKTFEYDVKHILPHGNYLINLGNPDPDKREKSYQCFLDELKRCEQLGLTLYNFHPGSSVGQVTQEESLSLVAQCLNRAHKETENVITVIESMVGSGNVLCSKFAEIGKIIEEVEDKSRVGVCLDTCHIFAAGYDIRTKEGWNATMEEFERDVGLKYLKGMHFNDSKGDLASRKDRHENIGLGHLGLQTFSNILNDTRTQDIPLILETPAYDNTSGTQRKNQFKPGEGWDIWRTEVAVLNRLAGSSGATTSDGGRTADFEKYTDEIRTVVKRVSSAAEKQKDGKPKAKQVRRAKKSKDETDDELEDGEID